MLSQPTFENIVGIGDEVDDVLQRFVREGGYGNS